MADGKESFWQTLPGILTALAGVIGAIAALLTALHYSGPSHSDNPISTTAPTTTTTPTPTPTPAPAATSTDTTPTQPPAAARPQLAATSFVFPGAGQKNNNGAIGPFCCTGETAKVDLADGTTVGYIYFYGFEGAINIGNSSAAQTVSILVSGAKDLANPAAEPVKEMLSFAAVNTSVGTTRTVQAGQLKFDAHVLSAPVDMTAGRRLLMDGFQVRVDVRLLN